MKLGHCKRTWFKCLRTFTKSRIVQKCLILHKVLISIRKATQRLQQLWLAWCYVTTQNIVQYQTHDATKIEDGSPKEKSLLSTDEQMNEATKRNFGSLTFLFLL